MNALQKNLILVMPLARRYGRALTGDTHFSDLILTKAATSLLKTAPPFRLILPQNLILPWLLLEFHRQLDSNTEISPVPATVEKENLEFADADVLQGRLDVALQALTESQRRVFLLTTLEQFKPIVIARILSVTSAQVQELFYQAHVIVLKEYIKAHPIADAA